MSTPFFDKCTRPMDLVAIVLVLLFTSHSGFIAGQQKYPTKPVRIIYPSATGSTGEVRTRVLADKLSQRLGQPAKTLKEFVALAKAKPGAITVAHGGVGVANHLPAALFFRTAGIQVLLVPYKGESAALPDLMGGQVDALFSYSAVAVPQIKAGKVRALAFAGVERNHAVPEVLTFPEAGFPGFHFDATMLLLGPAGLPKDIVALLNREIALILQEPDVRATYATTGSNPVLGSPEDLAALIKLEMEINGGLVKELGIVLE